MDSPTLNQILIVSIVLVVIGIILLVVYAVMKKNSDKDSSKKAPSKAINVSGVILLVIGVAVMGFWGYKSYIDVKPASPFAVHMMSRHNQH